MTTAVRPNPQDIRSGPELAAALAGLRALQGRSVRDVAKAADLPSSTLGGYLSGRHLPPLTRPEAFVDLVSALGVPPEAHDDWLAALRRAHQRRATQRREPYRGLDPFETEDREVFFGRDDETAALADLVRRTDQGIVVVLGASGSGKSSLVRAGLLGDLADTWTVSVVRPGTDLLSQLSSIPDVPGDSLLVIDQFEELWTRTDDPSVREAAVDGVAQWADRPCQRVVLVVRSDFYAHVADTPQLVEALGRRAFLVPSMGAAALARTITGPAERVGSSCAPGLATQVVHDLTLGNPDLQAVLPHLSHTLHLMWEHSNRSQLTLADYEAVGGVAGAISRSAEEAYAALSASQQELAQGLLLRLVVVEEDQRPTGGALTLDASIPLEHVAVLEHFAHHRLISLDDLQARFSHEAVLSAWDRLARWIEDDRVRLGVEQVLDRESRAWSAANRDPGLLLRGVRLDAARAWLEDPASRITAERSALVTTSLAAHDAEALSTARRLRRSRLLLAAVSAAAVSALAASGLAINSERTLSTERSLAEARQLAAEAAKFAPTDPMVARELAVASFRQASTLQSRAAVIGATGNPSLTTLSVPVGSPAIGADPRRPLIAIGSTGATFSLEDVSGPAPRRVSTPPAPSAGTADSLDAFAWSPTAPVLAVISAGGAAIVYDVTAPFHPRPIGAFTVPTYFGGGIDFSPTGDEIAVGTRDNGIHFFSVDATAGTVIEDRTVASEWPVASTSYLPDGRLITGSTSGLLTLRTGTAEHAVLATTTLGQGRVTRVRAAGTAAYASTRRENVAYRISLEGDGFGPVTQLASFDSWVNDVGVSPDGHLVTFSSSDGTVRTVSPEGRIINTFAMPDIVTHANYLSDGRLAVGVTTGQVVLRGAWAPGADNPTTKVFGSVWSADGRTLISFPDASGDQVRVWDVSDPDNPRVTAVLPDVPEGMSTNGAGDLSPDGSLIVAGTVDGAVLGWRHGPDGVWTRAFVAQVEGASINLGATKFVDDRHLFVVADTNRALLLDVTGGQPSVSRELRGVQHLPTSAGVSTVKRLYAAGLDSGDTVLWSDDSAEPLATVPGEGIVFGVAFTADGKRLVTGGQAGHVRVYDLSTPSRPRLVEDLIGAAAGIQDLDVARNGSIAGAGPDGSAIVFRATGTGHEMLARLPSSARLFSVRWSP
ncbi:MAG: helix-turn-helix domain-containing protein, partial [Propionibacteriaceae bacterium]|nr:helix-turn-helix domain-containing protein [Propionibacteriaceae bacterium]